MNNRVKNGENYVIIKQQTMEEEKVKEVLEVWKTIISNASKVSEEDIVEALKLSEEMSSSSVEVFEVDTNLRKTHE